MVHFSVLASAIALAAPAAAWNPNNNYAPTRLECPSNPNFVTRASGLSQVESDWVTARHAVTDPILVDFLKRMNMTDFNPQTFLSNVSLNIGLSFSGGGYRAMLCGAGQFSALDNRTINSTQPGHLGGLLQASTYLVGLSGGNWMVNSIALNNFTSVQALQGDKDLWDLTNSIYNPGGLNIISTASYYDRIVDDVDDKRDAGYNVSITDIWGRALSQQFIGLKNGGPALQFSDIREYDAFKNHQMPYPVVVAVGRAPGTKIISTNSTVFEISPYHLGTWDPSLYAFTDTYYLGSNVTNGQPVNNTACVAGFDNGGFILGTSSSLFNQFILRLNSTGVSGTLYKLANTILTDLDEEDNDIAVYGPNPFYGVPDGSSISNSSFLALVDGGEDAQNVPFYPLQQHVRNVDVVFAYDNSADTKHGWPNGASIAATYIRQFGTQGNHSIFPSVPDNNTFVNLGLNQGPVFFGCNVNNFTELRQQTGADNSDVPPLIVYISNAPYSFYSNTSTFKMTYDTGEVAGMIQNGYNVATLGNGTADSEWGACVGCAIIQRELQRRGQSPTPQCQQCYNRYCWNGTLSSNTPAKEYDPPLKLKTLNGSSSSSSVKSSAVKVGNSMGLVSLVSVFAFALAVL